MDLVKNLGELALASRLKRLSDRLSKDVSLIYSRLDIDFEAKWFTIISALNKKSPMAITEIAANLGISHTAVNQLAKELLKKDYIVSVIDSNDERIHLLSLSSKGEKLCVKLFPIWEKIREANKEVINSVDPSFLVSIEKIESELDKQSMFERVWQNLYGTLPGNLSIVGYSPKMKKYFKQLNYEWLESYFTIEDTDKNVLQHPKEKIINNGGTILFALLDNEIVGTCAVIRHPGNKYELAKMAVTKKYQNRGIGGCLLEEAIKWLADKNAQDLYLLTNEELIQANMLYKKFGFERIEINPFNNTPYQRETYVMKLTLSKIINIKAA